MAKFSGVNYAGTQSAPPELIDQGQQGGKIRSMFDIFELTADLGVGDQIFMGGPLQEGSVLVDCKVSSDALGGSATVNVGWLSIAEYNPTGGGGDTLMTSNATGFFSALPVASAGVTSAHGNTYEGGGGGATGSSFWRVRLTSAVQVVIACSAVTSGATGKSIGVEVSHIVD